MMLFVGSFILTVILTGFFADALASQAEDAVRYYDSNGWRSWRRVFIFAVLLTAAVVLDIFVLFASY